MDGDTSFFRKWTTKLRISSLFEVPKSASELYFRVRLSVFLSAVIPGVPSDCFRDFLFALSVLLSLSPGKTIFVSLLESPLWSISLSSLLNFISKKFYLYIRAPF